MEKRILIGSIVAVVILVLVSFTGVVGYQTTSSDIVKASNDNDYVKGTTQTGGSEIIKRGSIALTPLDGPVEVIDQEQVSDCGWGVNVYTRFWEAQSFTPTLNTLTKVKVIFFPTSTQMPSGINLTVHIRASLTGKDLVNLSKDASVIQWKIWVEYDFPDITIIPGNKYYIICEANGGHGIACYAWSFQRNNGYKGGEAWRSGDYGVTWTLDEDPPTWVGLDCCFKTYGLDEPPNIPTIDGRTTGKPGRPYKYTFTSIDPDGDNISYYIKWGDGNVTDWTDFHASGTDVKVKHTWSEKGTYNITVKAKDIYGAESDWGTLTVTMPMNKALNINQLFLQFLQNHPHMFPIIRNLLRLE